MAIYNQSAMPSNAETKTVCGYSNYNLPATRLKRRTPNAAALIACWVDDEHRGYSIIYLFEKIKIVFPSLSPIQIICQSIYAQVLITKNGHSTYHTLHHRGYTIDKAQTSLP